MKKILRDVVIAAVLLIVVFVVYGAWSEMRGGQPEGERSVHAAYFAEQLRERAMEATGGMMPIEGYDAGILLGIFAGLEESDFDGVETIEGAYEYRGGSLEFVDKTSQYETSAATTISEDGYLTLLENLEARLDRSFTSESDIDALIEELAPQESTPPVVGSGVTRISGYVVVGPQCPVSGPGVGENGECSDVPYEGTVSVYVDDPEQELIVRTETSNGVFIFDVEPARYIVRFEHEGTFPVCEEEHVSVEEGEEVVLNVTCDSGIR